MGALSLARCAAPCGYAASCPGSTPRRRQCRRPHDGADRRRQRHRRAERGRSTRIAAARVAGAGGGQGSPCGGRRRPNGCSAGGRCRKRNGNGTGPYSGRGGAACNRGVAPRRAAGRAGGNCAIGTIGATSECADASATIAPRGDRRGIVLSAEPAAARLRAGTSAGRAGELAGLRRNHTRRGYAPQRVLALDDGLR